MRRREQISGFFRILGCHEQIAKPARPGTRACKTRHTYRMLRSQRQGCPHSYRVGPRTCRCSGNELADSWAVDEAQRESRRSGSKENTLRHKRGGVGLAFLKAQRKKEAVREWRAEIIRRSQGSRSYRVPAEGEVPRIPAELRKTPKELAPHFFQLASGHAMIAPFNREKFGWIESNLCW